MKPADKTEMQRLSDKYRDFAQQRNDYRDNLRKTTCPALIIAGGHVIAAYNQTLASIRADWQILENKRIAAHKKSFGHRFLMATKGLNGAEILSATSKLAS